MKTMASFLAFIACLSPLPWVCEKATKGFSYPLVLSNLPNSDRWTLSPPSEETRALLCQPFTFLGRGSRCFAFLGADQTTVLKLFRHDHLLLSSIARHPSWDLLHLKAPPAHTLPPHLENVFESTLLLYKKMPQETGLLCVHLNKTTNEYGQVTLLDRCGIAHQLDLDATEFLLQKRAEPVYKHLNKKIRAGDLEGAKKDIDTLLVHLIRLSKAGLKDTDRSIGVNFGFLDDRALTIDTGSFLEDDSLTDPAAYKKELLSKTLNLQHFLKKRNRLLYEHYVDALVTTLEDH